jgi:hypothetical protein
MKRSEISKLGILSLIAGLSVSAAADINIQEGSFQLDRSIDLAHLKGTMLQFRLVYNSRLLHEGHFGRGWCSDLDRSVHSKKDGRSFLNSCGQVVELTQHPSWDERQRSFRPRKGLTWIFNRSGDLTEIHHNNIKVQVDRPKKDRFRLRWPTGELQFSRQPNSPYLTQAQGPERKSIQMQYRNGMLVGLNDQIFNYDSEGRLTEVIEKGKPQQLINYDVIHDRVISVNRGPCRHEVSYRLQKNRHLANSRLICGQFVVFEKQYVL